MIKEFREFFLRHTTVNSGAKKDQEIGYPLQYFVDGILKYNRFLKGDYPSENTFKKLLESITFKLNPEDTATNTLQGIGKTSTDADAIAGTQTFADAMARFVKPYQLPSVIADNTGDITFTVTAGTETLSGGRTRRKYTIKGNYTPPISSSKINVVDSQPDIVDLVGGSGLETLVTFTLPANTLIAKGDFVEVETFLSCAGTTASPLESAIVTINGVQCGGLWFAPTAGNVIKMKVRIFYNASTSMVFENVSTPLTGQVSISAGGAGGVNFAATQTIGIAVKSLGTMVASDVNAKFSTLISYRK